MQDKVIYEYAILRLVPKVEREEFFNVGVIVYAREKKFLAMKHKLDLEKLDKFGCDVDSETIENYLKSWEKICRGEPEGGAIGALDIASRFRWLVATRSTIIQSSKTHSGLCGDPEKTLLSLFDAFVL